MNSIRLLFLQYPRKARGQVTVAATVNSNHDLTVAVRSKRISLKKKQISSVIPAASDAPFSLYKGAHSSVFGRLYFSASAFTISKKYPPSPAKVFIAEIP